MTSVDRRSMERRVRVALIELAKKANAAVDRFREMTQGSYVQESFDAVEDMDFVMDQVLTINEPITYFNSCPQKEEGVLLKKSVEDLVTELQDEYCKEAIEYYDEDDNFDKQSDLVIRIKNLNEEARVKEEAIAK